MSRASKLLSMAESSMVPTINRSNKTDVECINKEKVDHYATTIGQAFSKTAEAILQLAVLVYDASTQLNEKEWKLLDKKLGKGASGLSKLKAIGRRASVLIQHQDSLPTSVATLYMIASKLDEKQIEASIQSGHINQYTTNGDAAKLVGMSLTAPTHTSANLVTLVVNTNANGRVALVKHYQEVSAALAEIRRGYQSLEALGFDVPKHRFEGVDVLEVTAKVAA